MKLRFLWTIFHKKTGSFSIKVVGTKQKDVIVQKSIQHLKTKMNL
jgi:hypothetical protein